jgi:hypothetical protein
MLYAFAADLALALRFAIFSSSQSIFLKLQEFQKGGYRNGRRSNLLSSGAVKKSARQNQSRASGVVCETYSSRCYHGQYIGQKAVGGETHQWREGVKVVILWPEHGQYVVSAASRRKTHG